MTDPFPCTISVIKITIGSSIVDKTRMMRGLFDGVVALYFHADTLNGLLFSFDT
jgi:hypothetical protein